MCNAVKTIPQIPVITLDLKQANVNPRIAYFPKLRDFLESQFLDETEQDLSDLFGYYSQICFGDYSEEKTKLLSLGYPLQYDAKWMNSKGLKYEDCFIKLVMELNKLLPNWKSIVDEFPM